MAGANSRGSAEITRQTTASGDLAQSSCAPSLPSLLKRDLPFWICSLRTWLVQIGYYATSSEKYLHSTQTYITYSRDDRHIGVLQVIYGVLEDAYDDRPEMEKDIWDLRKLGVELDLSKTVYKLNFTYIAQPWLRLLAKKYLAYNLAIHGVGDCVVKLGSIRQFSLFLEEQTPAIRVTDLDRRGESNSCIELL